MRLGDIYESRLGDVGKAIETYQAVLARDPGHRGALESLARLYEGKGDLKSSSEALEKLLELSQGDEAVSLALRLADVYSSSSRTTKPPNARSKRGLTSESEKRRHPASGSGKPTRGRRSGASWPSSWRATPRAAGTDPVREGAHVPRGRRAPSEQAERPRLGGARCSRKASASPPAIASSPRALRRLQRGGALQGSGRGAREGRRLVRRKALEGAGQRSTSASRAPTSPRATNRAALAELDQAFKIDPGSVAVLRDLGAPRRIEMGDLDRAQKTYRALLLQKLDATSPITKGEVFFHLGEISQQTGRQGQGGADARARARERAESQLQRQEPARRAQGVKLRCARRSGSSSGAFARLYLATLRLSLTLDASLDLADPRPWVLCFWHGDQFSLLRWRRRRSTVALVSHSKDGQMQARRSASRAFGRARLELARRLRGLRAIVRQLRSGRDAAFAVDGPRGPRFSVAPGASSAAELSSGLLVPMGSAAPHGITLERAWDRFRIPLPFSRVAVWLGAPRDPGTAQAIAVSALRALRRKRTPC